MTQNPLYAGPAPEEAPESLVKTWSVSQLVSYNLLRARRSRGWTQQELGILLGKYTGRPWSNASVSAAERAYQGGRSRKFDLDEVNAFCAIFDVPFAYFMLPPAGDFVVTPPAGESEEVGDKGPAGMDPVTYLRRVLAVDPSPEFLTRAQEVTVEHATLDFIPAKWEYVFSAQPVEETVQRAEQEGAKGKGLEHGLDIPENVLEAVLEALIEEHSEELVTNVAARLEERGYLRNPEVEEMARELRDLREKVSRVLSDRSLPTE
ncbi:helix-turn-helix domain-containing protein [Streptomyces sp. MRC013]|uniref:helix-turn-helix domain-containing protein n=1 Tax=Streptomyces sp. MRC013 TaxID=2898276 RepID=UPI002026149A|nr:helix-turn-helix transcriptional regulator [Streptomyces sp. MRC013]URM90380.1 helix-turn-helix domain-containing protein [Streptomyces sp. MRC013]